MSENDAGEKMRKRIVEEWHEEEATKANRKKKSATKNDPQSVKSRNLKKETNKSKTKKSINAPSNNRKVSKVSKNATTKEKNTKRETEKSSNKERNVEENQSERIKQPGQKNIMNAQNIVNSIRVGNAGYKNVDQSVSAQLKGTAGSNEPKKSQKTDANNNQSKSEPDEVGNNRLETAQDLENRKTKSKMNNNEENKDSNKNDNDNENENPNLSNNVMPNFANTQSNQSNRTTKGSNQSSGENSNSNSTSRLFEGGRKKTNFNVNAGVPRDNNNSNDSTGESSYNSSENPSNNGANNSNTSGVGNNRNKNLFKDMAMPKKYKKKPVKRARRVFKIWLRKFLVPIIITIIFIVVIVGVLSFFINMPGAVMDKIKEWGDEIWTSIKGFVVGYDLPTNKEVESLAKYLDEMGYDLELWGFATVYDYDEKSKSVEKLDSKYIPVYLAAEERCYMISEENISLASFFSGIASIFTGADKITFGTGNIRIEDNGKSLLQIKDGSDDEYMLGIKNKVAILRQEKELLISRQVINSGATSGGMETYRYKLKYWLEKYATPVEFYLALHLASGAPEFAYSMAVNPTQGDGIEGQNTRIDLGVAVLEPGTDVKIEVVYPDIDNKTKKINLDENGKAKFLTVSQVRAKLAAGETVLGLSEIPNLEEILSTAEAFNATNLIAFTPYITKVINHWYYKEVVYQGIPHEGTYKEQDINVYTVETLVTPLERYSMYTSTQTGSNNNSVSSSEGSASTSTGGNTSTGTTNGTNTNTSTGTTSGTNTNTSTGTTTQTNPNTITNTGIGFSSNEASTGDDRKELAELSKVVSSGSIGSMFFGNGILGNVLNILVNRYTGLNATWGGISGFITGITGDLLNGTFLDIGSYTAKTLGNAVLGGINEDWARGLNAYISSGSISGAIGATQTGSEILNYGGQALSYTNLNNVLGFTPTAFQNSTVKLLGEEGIFTGATNTIKLSDIKDFGTFSDKIMDSFDANHLMSSASNIADYTSNLVSAEGISNMVDSMSNALSDIKLDEIADGMVNDAKQIFTNVKVDEIPTLASAYIKGVATNLATSATETFRGNWVEANLGGMFTNGLGNSVQEMALTLIKNETCASAVALTSPQLEGVSNIDGLDLARMRELNTQLKSITDDIKEAKVAADEMTKLVDEDVLKYAEMDSATMCSIAEKSKTSYQDLEEAKTSLQGFQKAWRSNEKNITSFLYLQVDTKITEALEAIEDSKDAMNSLNTDNISKYAEILYTAGYDVKRLVEEQNSKISGVAAYSLKVLSSVSGEVVMKTGTGVLDIDVQSLKKYKMKWPEATMETFLADAAKIENISPKLSGMDEKIENINDKLENLNNNTIDEILRVLATYSGDISSIEWLSDKKVAALQEKLQKMINEIESSRTTLNSNSTDKYLLGQISLNATAITSQNVNNFVNQTMSLPNTTIKNLTDIVMKPFMRPINEMSQALQQKISELTKELTKEIVSSVSNQINEALSKKLSSQLEEKLMPGGKPNSDLKNAMTSKNSGSSQELVSPDDGSDGEVLEGTTTEKLTYWYIKETRYKDYIQKAEPILVPYNSAHWVKLFLENKYLIAGTEEYKLIREKYGENQNLFENEALIKQYGKSIWEASSGIFEETIYALLQSSDDVDTQYLLRYFKELFSEYGDVIQKKYNESRTIASTTESSKDQIKKDTIGWIFETTKKEETINTETGKKVTVEKALYEPISWVTSPKGVLYSKTTDKAIGFDANLNLISPANATVISKTTSGKNELGKITPSSLVLELKNTGDPNADGIRIVISGGDFTDVSVGGTVVKGQKLGVTSTTDITISVLEKDTHSLAADVSKYINPPLIKTLGEVAENK